MKKLILFGLIGALLLLAACGQQQYVCPDGSQVSDPAECPPEETEEPESPAEQEPAEDSPPSPEEQEPEEPALSIDDEIQALMDTADEKVNSFSFVYVGPPDNLPRRTYFVRGDDVKVQLPAPSDRSQAPPYTHVYIDTEADTAVGYCEKRDRNRCPIENERFDDAEVDDWYVRTPYQWLKDIQTATNLGNGPSYEGRSTTKASFTTADDVSGEMYILNFHGLPGKILLDSGETIEFRDLAINSVTEGDVTPPDQ